jgi:hypothetical protein
VQCPREEYEAAVSDLAGSASANFSAESWKFLDALDLLTKEEVQSVGARIKELLFGQRPPGRC